MDNKKLLYVLYDQSISGKFQNLYETLMGHHYSIDANNTVNLISACMHGCIKNPNLKISTEHLVKSLKLFISTIDKLDENNVLRYLQCVFHILKRLINENCIDLIADMEEVFLPSFLPEEMPSKQNKVYLTIGTLLHNILCKTPLPQKNHMLQIGSFITKMCCIVSEPAGFLNLYKSCFLRLSSLNITISEQEEYLVYLLKNFDNRIAGLNKETYFNCFLVILITILSNFISSCDFNRAKLYLNRIKELVNNWKDFEEHEHIFAVVELPLLMCPLEYDDKMERIAQAKKSLENLIKLWKSSKNLDTLKSEYFLLLNKVINYYKKCKEHWSQYPEDIQLGVLHFIYDISKLNPVQNIKCSCMEPSCNILLDANLSYNYFSSFIALLARSTLSIDSHNLFVKNISNVCEYLKSLKSNGCSKFGVSSDIFINGIYHTAHNLSKKIKEATMFYYPLLIQYILENDRNEDLFEHQQALNAAFCDICSIYNEDINKILAFSALAILLCPDYQDYFMSLWIKNKHNMKNQEEYNKISLVDAFSTFSEEITSLIGKKYILTVKEKIKLLKFEITSYKKKWDSRIPMMTVLKELFHLVETKQIVSVIVQIFGDYDLEVHEDVPVIVDKVIKNYEHQLKIDEMDTEAKTNLGVLYLIYYKFLVRDIAKKNVIEIEKNMEVVNNQPNAEYKDPDDECDVVSSYDSMIIVKYTDTIMYLNKALELFSSVVSRGFFNNESINMYCILMWIALEYRLICYSVKSIEAFHLALKYAQDESNLDTINVIEVVSFLIEKSNLQASKYLVDIAEEVLIKLTPAQKSEGKGKIVIYLICKAKMYLYSDSKESYKIFKEAMVMCNKIDTETTKGNINVLKSQLMALQFQYCMLPCDLEIEDHNLAALCIYEACKLICDEFKISKLGGPYHISILLDICEEVTKYFYLMRCPREVRQYAREMLLMTQKLNLSLRCATVLTYLAWADLYSSQYEDCQVKLNGIANILDLPKKRLQFQEELINKNSSKLDSDVAELSNRFNDIVLDNQEIPLQQIKTESLSSPVINLKPFYLPSFLKHHDSCSCFCCSCFEYQLLVSKKVRLDAIFSIKQKNWQLAQNIILGGLKFNELCSTKFDLYSSRSNFLLTYYFKKEYLSIHGYITLEFSKNLMRNDREQAAKSVNQILIDFINPTKLEHIYLYQEAILQKLVYLFKNINTEDQNTPNNLSVENTEVVGELVTTPESHHSKAAVPVSLSPHSPIKPSPKKFSKKKLFSSTSPVESINSKPSFKPIDETKLVLQESHKKENVIVPSPKIQIYTESSIKQSSKKKKPENTQPILPALRVTQTPVTNAAVDSRVRKTRTKLLTQKLKESAKKNNVANDDTNQPPEANKCSVRILKVVDDQENKINEKPVRKSTRNKK